MLVFVTGGAGFIGSNFIRYILDEFDDVRVVNYDALTYAGNLSSLADIEERHSRRYRFVRGDIRDFSRLHEQMAGADAVVNFAAESHVDRSIDGPGVFLSTNVEGAGNVLEAARQHEVQRCLQVSTDEVYGTIDEPGSFVETDPLEPNSPYSVSKASADLLCRAYRVTYDYPVIVTRTANNFGPYQHPEKLLPKSLIRLASGLPITLYGDGRNVRDWTDVGDNVRAQWLVLTEGTPGETYNVGAGNELQNRELVERLLDMFNVGDEMVEQVSDRPGHDLRYSVDTSKIRRQLGWAPKKTFDEALAHTADWYRTHRSWWAPLVADGATDRIGTLA